MPSEETGAPFPLLIVFNGSVMVRPAFAGALTEAAAIGVVDKQRVTLNAISRERGIFLEIIRFPSDMKCSEVE